MPEFWTVSRSFLAFLLMCVYGALLAYAVGMGHDVMYTWLQAAGIDGGAGTPWDSTRSMWIITALLYFILSLPPVLGLIVFGLSVCKRQRRDEFRESGEIYYQDD